MHRILFLTLFSLTITLIISTLSASAHNCAGAPYLYISYHGGSSGNNYIDRFTRDGCALSSIQDDNFDELRSMFLTHDDLLFVNTAHKSDSAVLILSNCDANNNRQLIGTFASMSNDSGISHPYGLSQDTLGNIYVSNQDTNSVLRFYGPDSSQRGQPFPAPSASGSNYPSLFVQFITSSNGVRGVCTGILNTPIISTEDEQHQQHHHHHHHNNNNSSSNNNDSINNSQQQQQQEEVVLVASEDDDALIIYDLNAQVLGQISLPDPVGVYYNKNTSLAYVSARDSSNNDAYVVSIDLSSLKIQNYYRNNNMTHPAGIVIYENIMFVVGHDDQSIFTFDLDTGVTQTLLSGLSDAPEQVILSYNC